MNEITSARSSVHKENYNGYKQFMSRTNYTGLYDMLKCPCEQPFHLLHGCIQPKIEIPGDKRQNTNPQGFNLVGCCCEDQILADCI